MPRSILVADDIDNQSETGKKRSLALREIASSLAYRLKTGVDLLHVEDSAAFPVKRFGFDSRRLQDWHSEHQKKLEELTMNLPVPARPILKKGSPAEQIQKSLRSKSPPELVVLGTCGRTGLERLLVGSVAEEVIRHSKKPVMVVGPLACEKSPAFDSRDPLNILVATDLGKNSRAPETYARTLSRRTGANVVFLHDLSDSVNNLMQTFLPYGAPPVNLEETIARIRAYAIKSLKQKVNSFKKQGISCDYKLIEDAGPPARGLLSESKKGYSLVIMGTHGRNFLLNSFFGSTDRETILHSRIPVIIVRSIK